MGASPTFDRDLTRAQFVLDFLDLFHDYWGGSPNYTLFTYGKSIRFASEPLKTNKTFTRDVGTLVQGVLCSQRECFWRKPLLQVYTDSSWNHDTPKFK